MGQEVIEKALSKKEENEDEDKKKELSSKNKRFSQKEDQLIFKLFQKYQLDWKKIASFLPGR